jgi:hypothetical protein
LAELDESDELADVDPSLPAFEVEPVCVVEPAAPDWSA